MVSLHILVNIFWQFLWLGCISFGGPAAHIGYFQKTFVERLQWLSQDDYGKLVALSQFLPGPGSSQVGFAIGLQRGGLAGGLAAFLGFTLPSFALMLALAILVLSPQLPDWLITLSYGLKLLAVVVVADAVLTMYKHFCQGAAARLLALFSSLVLLAISSLWSQLAVLLFAASLGLIWPALFYRNNKTPVQSNGLGSSTSSGQIHRPALLVFGLLFVVSLAWLYLPIAKDSELLNMAAQFYQSGSLVFGGGHVVLPLLQQNIGQTLPNDVFLLGYASAQGVPGPMFTLATFLGAQLIPTSPVYGALVATLALFLPGLLLVLALHRQWTQWANRPNIAGLSAALNAAVVGLLLSALINPVFSGAVNSVVDLTAAVFGFILLRGVKTPIVLLLSLFAAYAFLVY